MRKSAVAAAGLVTVAAVSGAAAQAGFASGNTAAAAHTKRFVVTEVASKNLSATRFAGTERIKSMRTGEVVGFDSYTGRFYPKAGKAVVHAGIALRGGVIAGRVTSIGPGEFRGPILKGSGRFAGIEGTIYRRDTQSGRAIVVLRYQL